MAYPRRPAVAARSVPSLLRPPPLKPLRPFWSPEVSRSKMPALAGGGGGSWGSVARNPVVPRAGVSGPSRMTEMVRAPDGFGGTGGSEGRGGQSREAEAVVLRNGSLEFRLDLTSEGLESTLNKLSKWVVAVLFGIAILWKHDAEAMWVAMGSVINALLSAKLKQIFNHERPDPALRSDPGMPSSHAQSIFYASCFVVLSLVDSFGINVLTLSVGTFTLACSSYLSWLRISQKLHTVSQVGVGAAIGSAFSIAWFWSWHKFVLGAFISSIWVRIVLVLGSAAFCVGFLVYVIQNWVMDDE